MAEDEAIFDPTLKKKKKKKKTTFDIDAALAEGNDGADGSANGPEEGETVAAADQDQNDDTADIDLDFTKQKKKKKKKPFSTDDLDAALRSASPNVSAFGSGKDDDLKSSHQDEETLDDETFNLDFGKLKKKKKKKNLDEIISEADVKSEDKENDENSISWVGSDRDYTYEELLNRAFEIMRDKNPDMAAGKKQKFVMRPPQVVKIGAKKTSFANFTEICKMLHRQPKHLLDFLLAELGTSGSVDGNSQLIIKGRFQQKQIENVLRRYIKEYVTCHTCRSPDTILQKDTRLFFLQCETCGSRCSVASIKSGFQAVTSKRAAIRAKTA
ncbi:eukaryotic translation initiation factor 2 subunit 2 isoform X2 [Dendroctonus ponderosae]|uniref:Eukaryotic translation initiation factor 2 subunit 2 n=1 Tax=Dendroctonus ponderosae TaxID=77166 RepID=A0AAR5PEB5_DENPD|nr:eukaryotic translation initiation factor 2 subunit 2 isoform X2 [Dendroctonus ponderosae]